MKKTVNFPYISQYYLKFLNYMLPNLILSECSLKKKKEFPLASDLKPGDQGHMVTCALLTYCFVIDEGGIWGNFLWGDQSWVLCGIVATTVIILQSRREKTH